MSDFERYMLPETATIKDALVALDKNSDDVLTLFIVDKVGKMLGTLTDGDVRRGLIQGIDLKDSVKSIMHSTFRYISDDR